MKPAAFSFRAGDQQLNVNSCQTNAKPNAEFVPIEAEIRYNLSSNITPDNTD